MKWIKKLEHWQILAICFMVYDFISIHLSYFLALWLRFDCVFSNIPKHYIHSYAGFITLYAAGAVVFFHFLKI